jgi:predicted amidohydrolase YtcJ
LVRRRFRGARCTAWRPAAYTLAASLVTCSHAPDAGRAPAPQVAQRALINGRIVTMDAAERVAEAIAIRDGIILAVGSTREILAYVDESTDLIDLGGHMVTPGLIDSHCHFASGAISHAYALDLSYPAVTSIADVVASVAHAAGARGPGAWIEGGGWDEGKLAERRYIDKADLDRAAPANPVWLVHTTGHYATANARALALAKITRDTPDPPGGTIDRDADGTPTGVLKETAMELVEAVIPPISAAQQRDAIAAFGHAFNAEGMTAVKDPGIDESVWNAYQQVHSQGKLTLRVFVLWKAGRSVAAARQLAQRVAPFSKPYLGGGDDRLISGGIKIFLDGSGGARTAWVYDDWSRGFDDVDAGNHGYPLIDPSVFREQVAIFHGAGLHVGVHAIGDRAIDTVVDTFAEVLAERPTYGLRHSVIHANLPTPHALDEMARLQREFDAGIPEVSPGFLWWIGDTYAGNWGPKRCRRLIPLRSFLERGIRWGGGSDYDVTPFPARYGIWASVARQTLLGVYGSNPYGTSESVDARTALHAYTDWNARQLFLEDKIGSLEVGKYADIAVWDRDLLAVETPQLKDARCLMTLLQGEIVYRAEGVVLAGGPLRKATR